MKFSPIETFRCEELDSTYCTGLTYTVFPHQEELLNRVKGWVREGKVVAAHQSDRVLSQLGGTGKVG